MSFLKKISFFSKSLIYSLVIVFLPMVFVSIGSFIDKDAGFNCLIFGIVSSVIIYYPLAKFLDMFDKSEDRYIKSCLHCIIFAILSVISSFLYSFLTIYYVASSGIVSGGGSGVVVFPIIGVCFGAGIVAAIVQALTFSICCYINQTEKN